MSEPSENRATSPAPLADSSFAGGGETGEVLRRKDWSRTPLGPIESWPPSLRTAVSLVLNSNFPISLAWGPHHVQIYNDGYRPICANKHPGSMGQDFTECWASAFPVIGDVFRSAEAGTTGFLEDQRMFLDRLGYLEETFFTFSFSPIRDEHGAVAGLFHPATETTSKMVGQRRARTLRDLTAIGLESQSLDEALRRSAKALADGALDVPFTLFYRLDEDRRTARLVAQTGLEPGGPATPAVVDLTREDDTGWPLARVVVTRTAVLVDDVRTRFPGLVCGPYPEPMTAARVELVVPPGHEQAPCLMVVGVSTRLPMNEAYTTFYELLGSTVRNVVASALASEAKGRRAEELAEIDRAKTAFFANISHEFRTPLTLMLGPLEEELAEHSSPLPAPRRERIETAHRNSQRLLKLVNTLLDFSRIEAGRVQASFQPTDLAALTAEMAGMFRSAIESAGLALTVDCPPLPEPLFVDRDMWEKVVLNLISNAFKHTFTGGICVALRWCGDHVELEVADSGVGIPAADVPRLFERFYQVKGARSRTLEGTGIGLALVQELVHLHGGTMRVASTEGIGSTFTATLQTGCSHLPAEKTGIMSAPHTTRAETYVEEALQWLPADPPRPATPANEVATADTGRPRIVWVDDNADMREYVRRLLSEHYDVTTVANGREAVAMAMANPPDLVLTDIMMPGLDGFGVLRELRANVTTRHVPVILLSARAGEEASVAGLEMGADDYLVKPFAARELLARVRTHIELAKLRRDWAVEQAQMSNIRRSEAANRQLLKASEESRHALLGILEDELQAKTAKRESDARYKTVFERAPDGIVVADASGCCVDANQAACRMFGYTRNELIGMHASNITMPAEIAHIDPAFAAVRAGADYHREWQCRRKDGSIFAADVVATQMPDGNPMAMFRDITERKLAAEQVHRLNVELEQRVIERTAELESANQELEAFSYSVSHDLRAPLRAVDGFSQALLEDFGPQLPAAGQRQLQTIRGSAQRMGMLIDDLLSFSRLSRAPVNKREFDTGMLVREVLVELQRQCEGRHIELRIGELPACTGDPALLRQVWVNLLSNAFKFTQKCDAGVVEIGCEAGPGGIVYFVRDNGAGFDMRYVGKLFGVFQRLHRADDYEGTGVGLAIVQRVIHRHGGRIWAEAAVDHGATFYFTLAAEAKP